MYASSVAFLYGAGTSDFFVIGIDGKVKYISRWYNETELQSNLDTLTSAPGERPRAFPMNFNLEQNYPNPFSANGNSVGGSTLSTTIRYEIRSDEKLDVTLTIYNLLGVPVRTLVNKVQGSGFYEVSWNATDHANKQVPAGAYFYTLQAGDLKQTRRIILLP